MKKFVALLLAVVLTLSVSVVAFAATASDATKATVTAQGSDGEAEVLVKIKNADEDPDYEDQDPSDVDPDLAVYSVTIDAADVVFTYSISSIADYDPETHTYPGSWDKNNGNIVVTNDSNTSITVTPAFSAAGATKNGVTAAINTASLSLDSAVGSETGVSGNINVSIDEEAPTVSVDYTLATVVLTIAGVEA